ncbi:MAG: nitroreductase family protein [Candidatus Parvarchaeota archaeon]|nr:nitroreductase family protein [Candidatus Jingweiarchaeum tengchongense]MCW1298076.1 nitroreductase family protein [Candidatus Jingweiarchaeum tengchongense]MCW1300124.1 nitroreductase family protein [Candidatus Jingweiarchaeum tengchongense]MCW1309626.1 nitroreductase family protein [Candidatus Jingweiarchaeum tengchongense]MCW1310886.1 nitroreductase family protein [Candidatus Jingweiarchaeum tengchongense]
MDVFEAIKKRRSVRSYEEKPIPMKKLIKILDAARHSPSAMNMQPWNFIIVQEKERRELLAKFCPFGKFLSQSPVVVIGCGDPKSKFYIHDVCIALQTMVIAATAEGLGTCWIGGFDEEKIKREFGIPEKLRIVAIIAMGYEKKKTDISGKIIHLIRPKKELKEIVHLERYGNPLIIKKK